MIRHLFIVAIVVFSCGAAEGGSRAAHKITTGFHPAVSPDGRSVAFAREDGGNVDIWTAGIDGSDLRRITRHEGMDKSPCWSPDGTRLAFVSARSGSRDLWVVPIDGSTGPVQLTTEPGSEDDPDWSRDGTRIAFSLVRDGMSTVGFIPADGGEITVLDPDPHASELDPAFSPDGRWLAIVTDKNGDLDVSILPLGDRRWDEAKADARIVSLAGANEQSPVWHPTRSYVLHTTEVAASGVWTGDFRQEGDAQETVQVASLISSALYRRDRNVTDIRWHVDDPVWTPDGLSIVFTRESEIISGRRVSGDSEIWIQQVFKDKRKKKRAGKR